MKYWFGYVTAAIIVAITVALSKLAEKYTALVDMVYPYLTRTVQNFLTDWSGGVNYLVWQVFFVLLIVTVLSSLVLVIVLRGNLVQWLGWVAAGAAFLFLLHTGVYGLNQYSGPLADDVRLQVTDYTLEELQEATVYYRDHANALASQVSRDSNGDVLYSDFQTLANQAGEGFKTLTYEYSFSVFAGNTAPVKELGWADMYTSMGITGVTMPLTGEAAVNPQIPDVSLPFTMCHEMAHRMCIASEQDANFAAFLSCRVNSDPQFQYSAYFMAYLYCYNALSNADSPEAAAAAARIDTGASEYLRHDIRQYSDFFAKHQDKTATAVADAANDTYIKASGDKEGIQSYGRVSDLLVSWYIQEIFLPAQKDEAESAFDPYDEDRVDLSGIVGALGG